MPVVVNRRALRMLGIRFRKAPRNLVRERVELAVACERGVRNFTLILYE